jgi:arylsulfatase A-like enzyme
MLQLISAALLGVAPLPTIIQIVADDLGYNDLGYENGGKTFTPHIDAMVKQGGIAIKTYYTYKVCAPSRASILSGRYPFGVGYYDMKGPEVVPTSFDLTPALLKKVGYTTAALGKWNLGHQLYPYTPTRRGFDTFFGYYAACQVDYW